MTATVPGVIGSTLVRWRRKILTLHTLGKAEERVSGTIFSKALNAHVVNTPSPSFTPFFFDAPYKFTPHFNLRTFIFGLTLFGWFISIYFFSYGNIIFDLRFFWFYAYFFRDTTRA
jgi:hypothetical protein